MEKNDKTLITDNTTDGTNILKKTTKGDKFMTFLNKLSNVILFAVAAFICFTNIEEIKQFFSINDIPYIINHSTSSVIEKPEIHVESQIIDAMHQSHNAAYMYCEQSLENLKHNILYRVDRGVLDDYFTYTKTKIRDTKSLYHDVYHFFDESHPDGIEVMAEELEQLITDKVIMPEESQRCIEEITKKAAEIYMECFSEELKKIQVAYNIPEPAWNEYISDICNQSQRIILSSGGVETKVKVAIGSGIIGTVKVAVPLVERIAAKAGSKLAAKTGGKVAAKATVKGVGIAVKSVPVINLLVTGGLIAWDYFDFKSSSETAKQELRSALAEYLEEVKIELLQNGNDSIMGSLIQWENEMKSVLVERM